MIWIILHFGIPILVSILSQFFSLSNGKISLDSRRDIRSNFKEYFNGWKRIFGGKWDKENYKALIVLFSIWEIILLFIIFIIPPLDIILLQAEFTKRINLNSFELHEFKIHKDKKRIQKIIAEIKKDSDLGPNWVRTWGWSWKVKSNLNDHYILKIDKHNNITIE